MVLHSLLGFPGGSEGKASACNVGDPGSIPSLIFCKKIPCRRKWQCTPVLLPRKFHGWRSLVADNPCGHKESGTTEQIHLLLLISQFTKLFTNTNYVMVLVITTNHLMLVSHRLSRLCKVTATEPEHKTWPSDSNSLILFFHSYLLISIYFRNLPVQVRCKIQEAWGWCTGMT